MVWPLPRPGPNPPLSIANLRWAKTRVLKAGTRVSKRALKNTSVSKWFLDLFKSMVDSVSVRFKNARVENKPLNIRIQWNAGTAWVSECGLKTLACRDLSVSPLERMQTGGAIPPPPQKGYLSDTCAIPYKNKASGCDTPLCDTISKGYCAIWGGISHWAAKRMMQEMQLVVWLCCVWLWVAPILISWNRNSIR